jgi:hypothetical protein
MLQTLAHSSFRPDSRDSVKLALLERLQVLKAARVAQVVGVGKTPGYLPDTLSSAQGSSW